MKIGTRVRSTIHDHESVTGKVVGNGWLKHNPVILVSLDKGGYIEETKVYTSTIVSIPENFEEIEG